jgi:hypothetical protein
VDGRFVGPVEPKATHDVGEENQGLEARESDRRNKAPSKALWVSV